MMATSINQILNRNAVRSVIHSNRVTPCINPSQKEPSSWSPAAIPGASDSVCIDLKSKFLRVPTRRGQFYIRP